MDLMEAIKRIGVTDIHTKAIVYQGIGAETLMEEFRNGKSDLRDLIDSVATVELKRIHLRLIADIIIRALNDTRMMRKKKDIVANLRHHGYLAQVLERREPDNHDYQIRILSGILLGAFSGKLNHEDVIRVFHSDESLPSLGLLAAVALQVHDPADTWFALKECAIAYASYAQLDSSRQDELLNRFTFGPAFGAPAAERRAIAKGSSPASDERARGSGIEAAQAKSLLRRGPQQIWISRPELSSSAEPDQEDSDD